jgi:UDP-glucose 4-epimerase
MTKCVILGGAGFIGSHLVWALLERVYSVRVFDRPTAQRFEDPETIEWMEGDFLNREDVAEALRGCDTVFHLVSTTLPRSSNENPVYDIESNVVGTVRLLDLARAAGIRKIVFVSSGGTVYGRPVHVPIPESHPTDPICSYGIGKLTVEKYLHLYHVLYGLDYCVLRLANPYGPRQRVKAAQGAVTVFLHRALNGQPVDVWGDGSVVRDYIYIGDAVRAMVDVIAYDGTAKVFNIGSGMGTSVNDLLDIIESVTHRRVERRYTSGRSFDVPANVLDISMARSELGWYPLTPLETGIERTYRWMQQVLSPRMHCLTALSQR